MGHLTVLGSWVDKQVGTVDSTVALLQEGPGIKSRPVVYLPGVCMFSHVHMRVPSGYSGFLLQSENMTGRLIGLSKLPIDISVYMHA